LRDTVRVTHHENWFRVLFHLNGGITVVELTDDNGIAFPGTPWQVATESIPNEFRGIGTRILAEWDALNPEATDGVEEIRNAIRTSIRVIQGSSPRGA
jgi:hypothetical protein